MNINFGSQIITPKFGNADADAKVAALRGELAEQLSDRLPWALEEVPVNKLPSGGGYTEHTSHVAQATQKAAIIQAAATLATSHNHLGFSVNA